MTAELEPSGLAGCDVCRDGWLRSERPELVSPPGGPYLLYRCATCGTYWLQTERYASPIPREEAARLFPDSVLT
jgi:hypothetical protein